VVDLLFENHPSTFQQTRVEGLNSVEEIEVIIRDRIIPSLNPQSSPGLPFCATHANNEKLLEKELDYVVRVAAERIFLLSRTDPSSITSDTAEMLVRKGLVDVIRLFVKQEPVSDAKIRDHRERIIFSISVIDQIVERYYAAMQNNLEIATFMEHYSYPGIGFDDETNRKVYLRHLEALIAGVLAEADMSNWDITVKGWMLLLAARLRVRKAGVEPDSPFAWLIMNRSFVSSLSVLSFGNGMLVAQTYPFAQKSGRYVTSSDNSTMREAVHIVICPVDPFCYAMGDDSLEKAMDRDVALKAYNDLGLVCKDYRICKDSFEFCSHRYFHDRAEPTSWAKTFLRLASQKAPTQALLDQFAHEMRDSPHLDSMIRILSRVDWLGLNGE
jgi:hypothetical protein